MNRQEILDDIRGTFGLVPTMFQTIPDTSLESEWRLFKLVELEPGAIPSKYRELMGLALSAATKCRFCALFHTELAKLYGATDEEIEEAVHYAKSSVGWSTYLHGLQMDYEQFKDEVSRACEYVRAAQQGAASVGGEVQPGIQRH